MTLSMKTCACGHAEDAHEHYRRGSDCGACGPATCARFKASSVTVAVSEPMALSAPVPAVEAAQAG